MLYNHLLSWLGSGVGTSSSHRLGLPTSANANSSVLAGVLRWHARFLVALHSWTENIANSFCFDVFSWSYPNKTVMSDPGVAVPDGCLINMVMVIPSRYIRNVPVDVQVAQLWIAELPGVDNPDYETVKSVHETYARAGVDLNSLGTDKDYVLGELDHWDPTDDRSDWLETDSDNVDLMRLRILFLHMANRVLAQSPNGGVAWCGSKSRDAEGQLGHVVAQWINVQRCSSTTLLYDYTGGNEVHFAYRFHHMWLSGVPGAGYERWGPIADGLEWSGVLTVYDPDEEDRPDGHVVAERYYRSRQAVQTWYNLAGNVRHRVPT